MIKLLVVDDHELVRMGLSRLLEDIDDFELVGAAGSGEEAIKLIRDGNPDVVLMDLLMPGMGGLEATRRILKQFPQARIIAVTVCADDIFPSRLLQAGAAGYLTKDAPIDEVARAIRQVDGGKHYISPEIAQRMALKSLEEESSSPFDQLSSRELQIATLIVSCRKVGDIAEVLCLSPKTVNTYRYRVFNKLGIKSDVELTLLALKHNLIESMPVE